ncbi:MAG: ferritin-like domain-containing protein [Thermoleophilia bacterium]|nr:ferritin-like domain-containing protein [Thermoleophilia bacterium]
MNSSTPQMQQEAMADVVIGGMTRESFLLKSALAAGAVYGMGMVGPFVRSAFAAEAVDDLAILNFALTLEYLESDFYAKAVKLPGLSSKSRALAQLIGKHEDEHVAFLVSAIKGAGGTPVAKPTFTFPLKNEASFLMLAQTFEDTGVSAYNGAGPLIKDKGILAAAGTIVQVEGRHAAAIRLQHGETPAPNAFDAKLDMAQVLTAVKPFIKA